MKKIIIVLISFLSAVFAYSSPLITVPGEKFNRAPGPNLVIPKHGFKELISSVKSNLPPRQFKNVGGDSLIDLYAGVDTAILNSGDSATIHAYLITFNQKIAAYLEEKYPNLLNMDPPIDDPNFFIAGLVYSMLEWNNFQQIDFEGSRIPVWLRCIVDVCLGYFDIRYLLSSLGNFTLGSVMQTVGFCIKKYVGVIGAAILLYDIATQCLD